MPTNPLTATAPLFSALFVLTTLTTAIAEPGFEFKQTDEGVLIAEGKEPVLFYQRKPKSLDGKYTRANYVHPLYGLDGEVLTEDFPKDHPHHRGIFWAWHYLAVGDKRLGDGWACKSFSWDVYKLEQLDAKADQSSVALRAHVHWMSPPWTNEKGKSEPVVNETTTVRVYPRTKQYRAIDFEIDLQATIPDVHLAGSQDEKGYGGFSARIKQPEDLTFRTADGYRTAQHLAVSPAAWMDFTGTFSEKTGKSGIAILCHPTPRGFPPPWIIRHPATSMQNPVFPGREPFAVPKEHPLKLRYRLIIHLGDGETLDFNALQDDYRMHGSRSR